MIDIEELRDRVRLRVTSVLAVDYQTVTELLDRLEAAEEERDAYKAACNEWIAKTEWVQDELTRSKLPAKYLGMHRADGIKVEIDALRAKIAEMEQQEPAATIHINSITGNPSVHFIPGHRYLHHNDHLYALPGAQAQPAPSMPEVTDAMALAFHRALTDGSIGAREVEEIKDALRAALAATPGSSRDDQHAGGLKVLNHQGLMERARQNAKKEAGLIYPDDDARREEKEQELASEYYRQYTTPNP